MFESEYEKNYNLELDKYTPPEIEEEEDEPAED